MHAFLPEKFSWFFKIQETFDFFHKASAYLFQEN